MPLHRTLGVFSVIVNEASSRDGVRAGRAHSTKRVVYSPFRWFTVRVGHCGSVFLEFSCSASLPVPASPAFTSRLIISLTDTPLTSRVLNESEATEFVIVKKRFVSRPFVVRCFYCVYIACSSETCRNMPAQVNVFARIQSCRWRFSGFASSPLN